MALDEEHPIYGPFFGVMGAASAIIFTCTFEKGEKSSRDSSQNPRTNNFFVLIKVLVQLMELPSQELESQL